MGALKGGFTLAASGVTALVATMFPALYQKRFKVYDPLKMPNDELIVLVTGSSSGIGKDAAIGLAKKGYVVYGTVRKEKDAEALKSVDLSKAKGKIVPVIMDVTDSVSIAAVFAEISNKVEKGATFVGLVNNAGALELGLLEGLDDAKIQRLFDVNLFGVMRVTRTFLPLLRKSKGRIINVGSMSGVFVFPLTAAYASSKYAIEGYTDGLRVELLKHEVSVSLVQPGPVKSVMASSMEDEKAVMESIPADLRNDETYSKLLSHYVPMFASQGDVALPASETTTPAIISALMAKHPKTRYPVSEFNGVPASTFSLLDGFLPDRVKDSIVLA